MVATAFARLLTAGLLEVAYPDEAPREPLYRARKGLDTSLLDPWERTVISFLATWNSLTAILSIEGQRSESRPIHRTSPCVAEDPTAVFEAAVHAELARILDEALEYMPPSCACSL